MADDGMAMAAIVVLEAEQQQCRCWSVYARGRFDLNVVAVPGGRGGVAAVEVARPCRTQETTMS